MLTVTPQEVLRDQVSADHEEHIDPDVPAGDRAWPEVVGDNGEDCERTKCLQVRPDDP
ncbi:hypothetical protein GCM10009816_16600 [Microbacterium aquimaris]